MVIGMRAAVLFGPGDIRVTERQVPVPGRRVLVEAWPVVRKDITIHTSRGEGGGNVRRAISLAARGKLRGAEMVTSGSVSTIYPRHSAWSVADRQPGQGGYHSMRFAASFLFPPVMLI